MAAGIPSLVGRSSTFLRCVNLIERIARFDAPVLIQGETGTGKEMAARAIHYLSARREAPFVPVNCGAIPEALVESELFGCERGAFTDAKQARSGVVAAAEGGTLFLDELDSLSQRSQVALLRFLQDHSYRPVGSSRERTGHVQVIAAASARLPQRIASGDFREDLAFRLGVLTLEMPPLRERPGDPTLLARHFVARHARLQGCEPRPLHPDGVRWLEAHGWPGNVREVDNLVQRSLMLGDEVELRFGAGLVPAAGAVSSLLAVPPAFAADGGGGGAMPLPAFHDARERALAAFERDYLQHLMRLAEGNVTHAARIAGKERRALGKLLKKHGIDRAVFGGH